MNNGTIFKIEAFGLDWYIRPKRIMLGILFWVFAYNICVLYHELGHALAGYFWFGLPKEIGFEWGPFGPASGGYVLWQVETMPPIEALILILLSGGLVGAIVGTLFYYFVRKELGILRIFFFYIISDHIANMIIEPMTTTGLGLIVNNAIASCWIQVIGFELCVIFILMSFRSRSAYCRICSTDVSAEDLKYGCCPDCVEYYKLNGHDSIRKQMDKAREDLIKKEKHKG